MGENADSERWVRLRPDPELIDNLDGNKRQRRRDQASARRVLEAAIAADRAAGLLDDEPATGPDAPATP